MKKSELKQLVAEYKRLKIQAKKNSSQKNKIFQKILDIEHRYYHETGSNLKE